MKNKIDWGLIILNTIMILMDCFFIWFNLSFTLEYFANDLYNQAALFGLGAIVWSFLLYRDGKDIRESKNSCNSDEIVITDKDKHE